MKSNKHNNWKQKREKCSNIFKDTYDKCEKNTILRESIEKSIKLTKFYFEDHKFDLKDKTIKSKEYNIIITPERTLEAVQKYYISKDKKRKTGVLNFASAKKPGGGVWTGASSQEESLCRASTLYPCLITEFLKDNYYSYHIKKKSDNTNRIIYIPDILVFKSDNNVFSEMLNEKDWYNIDVITCSAHNQRAYKVEYEKLKEINYYKIKAIIECAVENNVDNLILGAYGCGAFGNDPQLVSEAFRKILIDEEYYKYFENVHFAIFTTLNDTKNLNEFKIAFEKYIKNQYY
jgi:uncharacterized protein (TIGR02452 family)